MGGRDLTRGAGISPIRPHGDPCNAPGQQHLKIYQLAQPQEDSRRIKTAKDEWSGAIRDSPAAGCAASGISHRGSQNNLHPAMAILNASGREVDVAVHDRGSELGSSIVECAECCRPTMGSSAHLATSRFSPFVPLPRLLTAQRRVAGDVAPASAMQHRHSVALGESPPIRLIAVVHCIQFCRRPRSHPSGHRMGAAVHDL